MPVGIQRKRTKGWKLPAGAVCVTRPGPWGNPWSTARVASALRRALDIGSIKHDAFWYGAFSASPAEAPLERLDLGDLPARVAVELFVRAGEAFRARDPKGFAAWLAPLEGRDLACWCDIGSPCHRTVLLAWANQVPCHCGDFYDGDTSPLYAPHLHLPARAR